MTAKALVYAENVLEVHLVYADALTARNKLDAILNDLGELKDKKRDLEHALTDRELEVAADEWGKHPDMAISRMEKHIKGALNSDVGWRAVRDSLASVSKDLDGLEFDRSMAEIDIKIAVSRMGELGGYLNYLAEVKRAANTTTPEKPETQE